MICETKLLPIGREVEYVSRVQEGVSPMKTLIKTAARRAHRSLMVAVFSLVSALPGFGAPGVIANGSFESGATGWILTGNVRVQSATSIYQATNGSKLAVFNAGNSVPNGVLVQDLATVPGQIYSLTFDMGALAYGSSQQRLEVEGPGSSAQTFVVVAAAGGKCRWVTKSTTFTAAASVTRLTFRDRSATTSDVDLLLDRISIIPRAVRSLTVKSTGSPFEAVRVAVGTPDENGESDGSTTFNRSYQDGTRVALTAPSSYRGFFAPGIATTFRFQKWLQDGTDSGPELSTHVTMDRDLTLTSEYAAIPVIMRPPAGMIANLGGTATFTVLAVGSPALSYQWRHNGIVIPGAAGDGLSISDAALTDVGTYDVVVSNVAGSVVSDTAVLTVASPSWVNGGFESNFQGWAAGGNVRIQNSPPATEGIGLVGFNAGNSQPNGFLSQSLAAVPGQSYLLTFDLGVYSYVNQDQQMQVEITGADHPVSQVFLIRGQAGGGSRWEPNRLIFTAARNAVGVTFRDVSASTFSIDLLLDHVAITPTQDGFSLVPAGFFQMGDSFSDGEAYERPVHSVLTSAFQIGKYEVSKLLWDEVRIWGASHGYADLQEGGGKAPNHPVHSIDWYSAVKWCNARSEKDGFTPTYRVFEGAYRNGADDSVWCDLNANGYRLPTEAEWEKAARGGLSGRRFPTGDTITHGQANYYSNVFNDDERRRYFYDISSTRGYHPVWATGDYPNTSPVGSFAPNGYGLYDMAGNVFEMCWDAYGDYSPEPQIDPRGPAGAQYRASRSGAWNWGGTNCRVAFRSGSNPHFGNSERGFRLARAAVH